MTRYLVLPIFVLLIAVQTAADETADGKSSLDWSLLRSLPDQEGFAGMFAGVSHQALIAAGGANFPDGRPWEGGQKKWYDQIFVLDKPDGKWQVAETRLPQPLAYGASVSLRDETTQDEVVVCIGGDDGTQSYADVFQLKWVDGDIETLPLPPLPEATTQMCGAMIDGVVYVAGGLSHPDATTARQDFWALDMKAPTDQRRWVELPTWPGPERTQAVAGVYEEKFYLFGGLRLEEGTDGKAARLVPYLNDAYCYTPGKQGQPGEWQQIADMPRPLAAAPSPAMQAGHSHLMIFGGVDGSLSKTDPSKHPGFTRQITAYHPLTNRWINAGNLPEDSSRVTAPAVQYAGGTVVMSGESRPGVRSAELFLAKLSPSAHPFGAVNWSVLGLYMATLVGMGVYFSGRETSTDDFFLAGRRVPWWAAGLSIFATQLSAITYLSIPARSYGTNWIYYLMIWGILAIAPIVVYIYLPFFRRLKVTSAYEYLELRFNLSVRLLGSLSFVAFQMARMGIVVLLPALALSAVTGVNVYVCIAIMGVLSTLYTVLGGIEAVIWTDVLQVFVLIGGALAALYVVGSGVEGGLGRVLTIAAEEDKFQLINWSWDFTGDALGVILLGAIFANLVPYTTDQAVIQRYLTTNDEKQAARAIWTNGIMSVPAAALFFFVGTALFVFYRENPNSLAPLAKADQIFPWFISNEMPAGLAGLVIAGVFAAAMSSLDSSIHSIATALTTDFVRRFRPAQSEHHFLKVARFLTVLLGIIGTGAAMLMASIEIKYLWDLFLAFVGLLGGTLCGLFMLGIFTRRVTAVHAWLGALISAGALVYVKLATDWNGLLYAAIGALSCFAAGWITSFIVPDRQRDLSGLTVYDMTQIAPKSG